MSSCRKKLRYRRSRRLFAAPAAASRADVVSPGSYDSHTKKKSVSSMIALRSVDGTLFLGSERRLHKVLVLDLMLERGPRCV